jgi:2-succinyl-6-hydroxy-2,4-cyclohexadiene-1-carboxylate synthase
MAELAPTAAGHLQCGAHQVWWERFGDGDRQAVCLLNGLAMHTQAWYSFLPELLDRYDVLLYDYLGQGRSACPDEPYLIPDLATHLRAILDHLDIARIHLVGLSYGGFVALDFARLFQQRLHTLVLSGILLSHERLFELYQAMSLRFYRGGAAAFELYTHYMYEKIFGEAFLRRTSAEQLEAMRERFHDRYRDRVHSLVRLTEAQDPFFAALDQRLPAYRAIRTPTLVIAGEQDRCIPLWTQRRLVEVLADARWLLIPDAGHVVHLERRDVFFPLLRRFFAAGATDFDAGSWR